MPAGRFFYDFSSPYAYLAARRLAEREDGFQWTPIVFAAVLVAEGREPWSFAADRSAHFAEIAGRARSRGLPEVRYPEGWPRETWNVLPLRATLAAEERGRELTLALYDEHFVRGRALREEAVGDAAGAIGLDAGELLAAAATQEVKDALRANTDAALAAGVRGIPSVEAGGELFWGEDRLDEALAAIG